MTAPQDERAAAVPDGGDDPYLWLEEVHGERALGWVRERNAETRRLLEARPDFAPTRDLVRAVLDSKERIPHVRRRGPWLYNFWQDEAHPRGLWRRTTLDEYRRAEPAWQTLLDLDALAADEGENWVWGGASAYGPAYRRALLSLSRGGADAAVVREFDLEARAFVAPADGGFALPEAKSQVEWVDADTLFVGTDTGPGSMTDSGYPRTVRRWRRGTPLADAPVVFEGEAGDVSVGVSVDRTPGHERVVYVRSLDFYRSRQWLADGTAADAPRVLLDLPEDAGPAFLRDRLLVHLRSDWQAGGATHPAGSLLIDRRRGLPRRRAPLLGAVRADRQPLARRLVGDARPRRADGARRRVEPGRGMVDRRPAAARRARGAAARRRARRRHARRRRAARRAARRRPARRALPARLHRLPDPRVAAARPHRQRRARAAEVAPGALRRRPGCTPSRRGRRRRTARACPTSSSGRAASTRARRPTARTPTLLYGYGGFEVSMRPWYSGVIGGAWLERGGVFVVANIRGGGEFGPAWHQAAVGANRQRSYDDFIAVAEDLIARRITSPRAAGHQGRQQRRAARRRDLRAAPRAVQRRRLPGAAARHAALPPAARRRLVDGRVRRPRRGRRLGGDLGATAPTTTSGRGCATRPCCSPPRRATTACTPATPARWRRA